MFVRGFRPLDVVNIPTKHFGGILKKKNAKFLGVDPLGYKKRGGGDHPTPVGDAPARDILCISLLVNSAVVPLINKGSVGQYREKETNIGRVNNSDVKLNPASRPKTGPGGAFVGHTAKLLSSCRAWHGWPNAKRIYRRACAGLLT